ncbi:MAG: carboxypeptidase regulatory-like domain-containing protein, partial [Balneolaceae bacterium]
MKYGFTAFLLLMVLPISCSVVQAQSYSLSGTVTDQENNPVENAQVYIAKTDTRSESSPQSGSYEATAQTDEKGTYQISNIEPDRYLVIVHYHGKHTESRRVEITDESRTMNFELSALTSTLDEVVVGADTKNTNGITRLQPVEGVSINESKKNEVLVIDDMAANLATNNSRQVYSKVPGLNIWQTDDAGIQTSVGGRGLS